ANRSVSFGARNPSFADNEAEKSERTSYFCSQFFLLLFFCLSDFLCVLRASAVSCFAFWVGFSVPWRCSETLFLVSFGSLFSSSVFLFSCGSATPCLRCFLRSQKRCAYARQNPHTL